MGSMCFDRWGERVRKEIAIEVGWCIFLIMGFFVCF